MNNINAESTESSVSKFILKDINPNRFAELCGQFNQNFELIERYLSVRISNRGDKFIVSGPLGKVKKASKLINQLYYETGQGRPLTLEMIHLYLQDPSLSGDDVRDEEDGETDLRIGKKMIIPRGENQRKYINRIHKCDLNFGIGSAGTGKTYLAVACAVFALEQEQVQRIILVRPAVEAGEKLGFLPGDLSQKVDPYLRPLYDALFDMLGSERVDQLLEHNAIEIAPLAYMRGRTLNHSFIILDEAQNTTKQQMKMFLTRIGFGSTVVVTGDVTQVDLPGRVESGLSHGVEVLRGLDGVGFTYFDTGDVVRHWLVQRIVNAYERYEKVEPHNKKKRIDSVGKV